MHQVLTSISIAAALTLAGSVVQAAPISAEVTGVSAPQVILVSGGCGPYGHRNPWGVCRPNGWVRPGPVVVAPYWRGPGWRFYNGCWRGPYGRVHCG